MEREVPGGGQRWLVGGDRLYGDGVGARRRIRYGEIVPVDGIVQAVVYLIEASYVTGKCCMWTLVRT